MLLEVEDNLLPGFNSLDSAALASITGEETSDLLRFRHRPGKRAVLHVMTRDVGGHPNREGVIWFFAGDKARRLAKRLPASRYDKSSQGLYEQFPNDHRLPQIRMFLTANRQEQQAFIGGELLEPPKLERYRPGLSCTFSCNLADGKRVYVKILANQDIQETVALNWQLRRRLGNTGVSIARCLAIHLQWQAIVYECASGEILGETLTAGNRHEAELAIDRTLVAMQRLSGVRDLAVRDMGIRNILLRAKKSMRLIASMDRNAGLLAATIYDRMCSRQMTCRRHLIHGDMKPDHVFINESGVTFIDTESLSMGDPDYDLALLEARMMAEVIKEELSEDMLEIYRQRSARCVTQSRYEWFLDAAILQVAKSFIQRPVVGHFERCRILLQSRADKRTSGSRGRS